MCSSDLIVILPTGVLQLLPINGFNANSLSLMHLAMVRASHLAFAIQGDP